MELTFNILDNLYRSLKEFCEYNSLDIDEYVQNCVEKQLNIDKFGDLNEILNAKPAVIEKPKDDVKEVPEKVVKETTIKEETIDVPEPKKKIIRRTLKAK